MRRGWFRKAAGISVFTSGQAKGPHARVFQLSRRLGFAAAGAASGAATGPFVEESAGYFGLALPTVKSAVPSRRTPLGPVSTSQVSTV